MELGKRLCELPDARGLTQDALGKRSGLANTYISRLENGRIIPKLAVLGRLAKALNVELYQLFFAGEGKPEAPKLPENVPAGAEERSPLELFRQMAPDDRSLLLSLARQMLRLAGIVGEEGRGNNIAQAPDISSERPTTRLNPVTHPRFDGTSPVTHISERRSSMAESEWAKRMAQEFKAGKVRKAEEDAELLEEQRTRKESAYELWTDVGDAFKHKA
jgi:transcriptional regulator with XRE-family HTH domain